MTSHQKTLQFRDVGPADPWGTHRSLQPEPNTGVHVVEAPRTAERATDNLALATQHVIQAADVVMRAAESVAGQPLEKRSIPAPAEIEPRSLPRAEPLPGLQPPRIRIDPKFINAPRSAAPELPVQAPVRPRIETSPAAPLLRASDQALSPPPAPLAVHTRGAQSFSLPEPEPLTRRGTGRGLAATAIVLLIIVGLLWLMTPGRHTPDGEARMSPARSAPPVTEPAGLPAAREPTSTTPEQLALAQAPAHSVDPPSTEVSSVPPPQVPSSSGATPSSAAETKAGSSEPTSVVSNGNAEPSALADCLAARPAKLRLSADKVARLLATGRNHMAAGRIADARIVFKRAADACDGYAAFALGASYDPTLLQKLGLSSPTLGTDLASARLWYEKAKKLGSAEAADQLEVLAALDHGNPLEEGAKSGAPALAASSPPPPAAATASRRRHEKAGPSNAGLIPWLDLFGRF